MTSSDALFDSVLGRSVSKLALASVPRTERMRDDAFVVSLEDERFTVITVLDDLDTVSAKSISKAIARAAALCDGIVIDLVACRVCDSASLAAMAKQKYVLRERLQFVIGGSGDVRRAFEVTGLSGASTMHATLSSALGMLRSCYEPLSL